jgi:hypothetical protein
MRNGVGLGSQFDAATCCRWLSKREFMLDCKVQMRYLMWQEALKGTGTLQRDPDLRKRKFILTDDG